MKNLVTWFAVNAMLNLSITIITIDVINIVALMFIEKNVIIQPLIKLNEFLYSYGYFLYLEAQDSPTVFQFEKAASLRNIPDVLQHIGQRALRQTYDVTQTGGMMTAILGLF